jgi:hypothetical protein
VPINFPGVTNWAATNATTQTVTLPTHATNDLLVVIAACKAATITSVNQSIGTPSGWTRLTPFADGTVNAAAGVGSVNQAVFYRVAAAPGETDPVVTWGGSQTGAPGVAAAFCFGKSASESWATPVVVAAATTNATSISVTMGSNPGIKAGDVGLIAHTTRDDSALTVPTWTATDATLDTVVIAGTPIASNLSNDMAATSARRTVTAGTASAAPVVTGTQAAAETGVTCFIRLRVTLDVLTPGTASLVTATFAPTVATPRSVTPTPASLTTTTFAPTVTVPNNVLVTPTTASLTTAAFAPTVTTPRTVTPSVASLTTATFAPRLDLGVVPGTVSLTTTTFEPTVTVEAGGVTVTPTTAALVTATFAPTITAPRLVTPVTLALTTARFAPTVQTPRTVTPAAASLTLTGFVPTINIGVNVSIPAGALVTATFAPTLTITQNQRVTPVTGELVTAAFAPTVTASADQVLTPGVLNLLLTGFIPTVTSAAPSHPTITGTLAMVSGVGGMLAPETSSSGALADGSRIGGTVEIL